MEKVSKYSQPFRLGVLTIAPSVTSRRQWLQTYLGLEPVAAGCFLHYQLHIRRLHPLPPCRVFHLTVTRLPSLAVTWPILTLSLAPFDLYQSVSKQWATYIKCLNFFIYTYTVSFVLIYFMLQSLHCFPHLLQTCWGLALTTLTNLLCYFSLQCL